MSNVKEPQIITMNLQLFAAFSSLFLVLWLHTDFMVEPKAYKRFMWLSMQPFPSNTVT